MKHTDRFNLFKDGRKLGANKRNYILSSVRQMFESLQTRELLRTGEAFGYYGHGMREKAGKLNLREIEVVNVDGKPVVLQNVPACRTLDISVDDDGTVTHTQEIFDTAPGVSLPR
ncbi:phage protein [Photobacterium aphoticum]|uniref:Phage protein n=1 Tax=Photobacterium aphoticum TaxID=754436 RepID=A0A090QXC1_9GAMM|nr:phage protein [Photobacterium aphoticum]